MIQKLLDAGFIKPSKSPWNAPLVPVKKKDKTWRCCIDYRLLNEITIKDAYPLPNIDQILLSMGANDYFSSIDLFSGYYQIPMKPSSSEKTAFSTSCGHFEFVVMPMGISNAPSAFQRVMDEIFRDLDFVFVYLDDIVIFSKSIKEHIYHLSIVFNRLEEIGLKMKPSKCKFGTRELIFLGHVISNKGIQMDADKIAAIKTFELPKSKKQLQRFLGMSNYYRKFIRNFGKIAKPLTDNLCSTNETKFVMTSEAITAFDVLKNALCNDVILKFPDYHAARTDPKKAFTIITDASRVGFGGALTQPDDSGTLRPLYFVSRRANKLESKIGSSATLEALGLYYICNKLKQFISNIPVVVFTDNKSIIEMYRSNKETECAKTNRWFSHLRAHYDLILKFKPGRFNSVADCLSRSLKLHLIPLTISLKKFTMK